MTTTESTELLLEQVIEATWSSMLGMSIRHPETHSPPKSGGLTSCVHISGGWNGTILFAPSRELARQAAAAMLAIPPEQVATADIHDAIAELCNILAGGMKSVLPGPSALSLPTVTDGASYEIHVQRSRVVSQLQLESVGQTFVTMLLEALPA